MWRMGGGHKPRVEIDVEFNIEQRAGRYVAASPLLFDGLTGVKAEVAVRQRARTVARNMT